MLPCMPMRHRAESLIRFHISIGVQKTLGCVVSESTKLGGTSGPISAPSIDFDLCRVAAERKMRRNELLNMWLCSLEGRYDSPAPSPHSLTAHSAV